MKTNGTLKRIVLVALLATLTPALSPLFAQGTTFTYQGRLTDNGAPYTGAAEFQPTLWNAASSGNLIANNSPPQVVVGVTNGLFVLPLNFGATFTGSDRWLQLEVRTALGPFTLLSARQKVTPAPYALTAGQLAGILPSAQLSGAYTGALTLNNTGNTFAGNGAGLTSLNASNLTGTVPDTRLAANVARTTQVWLLGGNAGTTPGTHFVGTTDNQPLELRANGQRMLRLEPTGSNSVNVVAGYAGNTVAPDAVGATISGGGAGDFQGFVQANRVEGSFGTISGGRSNFVAFGAGTVAGGILNSAGGGSSSVGGGNFNLANNTSTVGGGVANMSTGSVATVAGGQRNVAGGTFSAVGGGQLNTAGSTHSFVGGGHGNQILGGSPSATIPGGFSNFVDGDYAFAAGRRAQAVHDGAFVWADAQDTNFVSTTSNQVSFRCLGGVRFTGGGTGAGQQVAWTPGTISWSFSSDRNLKEGVKPLDAQTVLEKVSRLPVNEWNFKGHAQRHIGPMAQDFHAQFPLHDNDTVIDGGDLHGVALAAIQGLNQKVEAQNCSLRSELKSKDAELQSLKQRLDDLEKLITHERLDSKGN